VLNAYGESILFYDCLSVITDNNGDISLQKNLLFAVLFLK
jgi:hypothetical protein